MNDIITEIWPGGKKNPQMAGKGQENTEMKYLRAAVVLLFLLGIGVYGAYQMELRISQDTTIPRITSDREQLELPCAYTEEMLLEGLTAYDDLDGELTDQIMVKEMSLFQEKGISNVTYIVFDSYGQSASLNRPVRFVDYESPQYTLTEPLIFEAGSGGRGMDRIGAWDMIDGDITSLIIQTGSNVDYKEAGTYSIQVEVTNRFGDLQSIALPVHVTERASSGIQMNLEAPLVYLPTGASFDPMSYAPALSGPEAGNEQAELRAESLVNTEVPGVYEVHYQVVLHEAGENEEEAENGEAAEKLLGETWLVVVVRE